MSDEKSIPWETVEALINWYDIAKKEGYTPDPYQITHSSLLRRLLNNGPVFKKAPPKAFSYPWVKLIEQGYDKCWETRQYLLEQRDDNLCLRLNQTLWTVLEQGEDWWIAENRGWRIKAVVREGNICDGNWSPNVTDEEKEAIVKSDREAGKIIVDVLLLNPACDRELIF